MKIDIDKIIPISKVNQNFSEAARLTDEHGAIIIMKNNAPKFVLITFEKYQEYEGERGKENV